MSATVYSFIDSLARKKSTLEQKPWLAADLRELAVGVCRLQEQASQGNNLTGKNLMEVASEALCAQTQAQRHVQTRTPRAALVPRAHFPVNTDLALPLFMELLALTRLCAPLHVASETLYTACCTEPSIAVVAALKQGALFQAFVTEDATMFEEWALKNPKTPQLLAFLVFNSLLPQVRALGQLWLNHALTLGQGAHENRKSSERAESNAPRVWEHGSCPVCGSAVFMGQLHAQSFTSESQTVNTSRLRWHTCSFCQVTFHVKRVQCPFCLEEDAKKLRYFTAGSEPGFQVHVCESCKSYIKITDFGERIDQITIPQLDDLESLPLDVAAQQQGFERQTPAWWL